MKVSLKWLSEFTAVPEDLKAFCDRLDLTGTGVEGVEKTGEAFEGVVVGHVLTCEPHPDSDHMHVVTVDVGAEEPVQIVCGAPNIAADIKVPVALVGAVLPGDFKIKKSKLRGVVSMGMLCSARELGITEDHSGIWILPEDAPVGTDIREYAKLNDARIEVKLTPNRGDALSLIGIARDLHAVTGAPLTLPEMKPVAPTCDCRLPVRVEAPDLCGRFASRIIRNINTRAETPAWMKERLERAGQRSISALVDISNYVMLELGRPTHFYDLDKIESDHLTVRWAKKGESVHLLDDSRYDVDEYYGVICDGDAPECLAGIKGGYKTQITNDTKDVFIEAAFWHQVAVQGRPRKLNFSTDASYRYERGVDFGSNATHLEYITQLVLDLCGTPETKVGPIDDVVTQLPERKPVTMRVDRCLKVIGMEIPVDAMEAIFTRLGFEWTREGNVFTVMPPTYRFDIEIEEDLIEEVARLYGYEKLPDRPPVAPAAMKSPLEGKRSEHALRVEMAKLGYQELINFSFVPEAWEKDFADNEKPIRLLNPIASHLAVMRTQLIGGLVDILKYNLNHKAERVRVFEIGRVFCPDESVQDGPWTVKGIRQPKHIGGLAYGTAADLQWGIETRRVDFFDVKGDIERLVAPLKVRYVPETFPGLHPGRSAGIYLGEKRIGLIGELHPRTAHDYDLVHAPIVFEIDVADLVDVPVPSYVPLSKFQPMHRDLAVVVAADVPVEKLTDAVWAAKKTDARLASLEVFSLFDLYRPKSAEGADEKSLAFKIELVARGEEPLGELEADAAMTAILQALAPLGAKLRS
mgnify:FL=1